MLLTQFRFCDIVILKHYISISSCGNTSERSADLYSFITKDANLYGTKLVCIPTPRFIIFYNGKRQCPERQELRLSTSFSVYDEEPSLELRATLLNINPGFNEPLKNACKTLNDYSEYTSRLRLYAETMKLEDAVERAINECIKEGILADFLSRNRAEAMKMSIYEYDEERHMRQMREEGFEDGFDEGKIAGCIETYQSISASKEAVMEKIMQRYALSREQAQVMMQKYWTE